jgi:hypothetical protein
MEYQGWSRSAALRELKAHGFGEWAATSANDYVDQYLLRYEPRGKHGFSRPTALKIPRFRVGD